MAMSPNGMARPCSRPQWRKPCGSSNAKEHVPCHPIAHPPRSPLSASTSVRTPSPGRPRYARRDCFATEALARPDRATTGKCAVLPHRHGSLLGRPPHRPPLDRTGPRRPANPSTIREAVPQRAQERLPRPEAIAEAVQRPTMRFVAIKTPEQMDLLALHRVRSPLVGQRTGVINQIRGFLIERGITVRQGVMSLRKALPDILSSNQDALSPRMVGLIADLAQDWRRLDERIAAVSAEIEALARQDDSCQRLMTLT